MNGKHSIQIQSVLYHNEKEALLQALENIANAIRVDRRTDGALGAVTVCYGDASAQPLFAENEIEQIKAQFSDAFSLQYTFSMKIPVPRRDTIGWGRAAPANLC